MSAVAGLINLRARSPLRIAGHGTAKWDSWIVGSISALLLLGLVMVYSASVSIAERATGNSLHYLVRHIVSVVLGVTGMLIVMRKIGRAHV